MPKIRGQTLILVVFLSADGIDRNSHDVMGLISQTFQYFRVVDYLNHHSPLLRECA